jgi:hypothetical protein
MAGVGALFGTAVLWPLRHRAIAGAAHGKGAQA